MDKIEWGGTPGPWKAKVMGGSSTVICPTKPKRNDTRIPAYGYDEKNGHCAGYPFIDDQGWVRHDFVCFSHKDARAIAEVPIMTVAIQRCIDWFDINGQPEFVVEMRAILARIDGGNHD